MKSTTRVAASILTLIATLGVSAAHAAAPAEGYLETPDGVKLYYRTAGAGEQIVLLPGGMYLFDDFRRLASGRKLIAYDQRNRGRSETVQERSKLERGVLQDADDLEAVRRHFGAERVAIIAHSYMGLAAALHAAKDPAGISRFVQIGPPPPVFGKRYEPDTNAADPIVAEIFTKIGALQSQRAGIDAEELCARVWEALRPMYVAKSEDAHKLKSWGGCDLPNERSAMQHFNGVILPSMKTLTFSPEQLARISMPVLTIHGTKDRNAPYGGGREWTALLPNARFLTVEDAAHAPWIEAPDLVFGAIDRFLEGEWPPAAVMPASRPPQSAFQKGSRPTARAQEAAWNR
jgi:proline iminopeptidase